MNTIEISIDQVDNSCFVVMPFSILFQVEYEKIIQPALREINIEPIRGDEIYSKQRIVDDIWHSIKRCRFVLAELTGKNPNVLYEIGLAHAIGKPVIIITRNGDDVPFDLKALRYLFYDVNDPFWGDNLKLGIQNLARKIIENPKIDNYLEGINTDKINYLQFTERKVEVSQNIPTFNIGGTWLGEFKDHGEIIHKVTLQINQNNDNLVGAAIITYNYVGQEETIVQQIMNGSINTKDEIKFYGVNFTFIKSTAEDSYALDNFDLKYKNENDTLIGVVNSKVTTDRVLNTEIILKRI